MQPSQKRNGQGIVQQQIQRDQRLADRQISQLVQSRGVLNPGANGATRDATNGEAPGDVYGSGQLHERTSERDGDGGSRGFNLQGGSSAMTRNNNDLTMDQTRRSYQSDRHQNQNHGPAQRNMINIQGGGASGSRDGKNNADAGIGTEDHAYGHRVQATGSGMGASGDSVADGKIHEKDSLVSHPAHAGMQQTHTAVSKQGSSLAHHMEGSTLLGEHNQNAPQGEHGRRFTGSTMNEAAQRARAPGPGLAHGQSTDPAAAGNFVVSGHRFGVLNPKLSVQRGNHLASNHPQVANVQRGGHSQAQGPPGPYMNTAEYGDQQVDGALHETSPGELNKQRAAMASRGSNYASNDPADAQRRLTHTYYASQGKSIDNMIVVKGENTLRKENTELVHTYTSKEYSELKESQQETIKQLNEMRKSSAGSKQYLPGPQLLRASPQVVVKDNQHDQATRNGIPTNTQSKQVTDEFEPDGPIRLDKAERQKIAQKNRNYHNELHFKSGTGTQGNREPTEDAGRQASQSKHSLNHLKNAVEQSSESYDQLLKSNTKLVKSTEKMDSSIGIAVHIHSTNTPGLQSSQAAAIMANQQAITHQSGIEIRVQKTIGDSGTGLYPQQYQQVARGGSPSDQARKDAGEDRDESGRGIGAAAGDADNKARLATPDSLNNQRKSVLQNLQNAQNLNDMQEKKGKLGSSQLGSESHQNKNLHVQGGAASVQPAHRFDNAQSTYSAGIDTSDQKNYGIPGVSGFSLDRLAHNLGLSQVRKNTRDPYLGAHDGQVRAESTSKDADHQKADYYQTWVGFGNDHRMSNTSTGKRQSALAAYHPHTSLPGSNPVIPQQKSEAVNPFNRAMNRVDLMSNAIKGQQPPAYRNTFKNGVGMTGSTHASQGQARMVAEGFPQTGQGRAGAADQSYSQTSQPAYRRAGPSGAPGTGFAARRQQLNMQYRQNRHGINQRSIEQYSGVPSWNGSQQRCHTQGLQSRMNGARTAQGPDLASRGGARTGGKNSRGAQRLGQGNRHTSSGASDLQKYHMGQQIMAKGAAQQVEHMALRLAGRDDGLGEASGADASAPGRAAPPSRVLQEGESGEHVRYAQTLDRRTREQIAEIGPHSALDQVYGQNDRNYQAQDDFANPQMLEGSLSGFNHASSTPDYGPQLRDARLGLNNNNFFNLRQSQHRTSLGPSPRKFHRNVKSQMYDSNDLRRRPNAMATQSRFGQFPEGPGKDKSKFFIGGKNPQLSESVLERLIGPASDDMRTSNILDKDTVASIKEAKKRVQDENQFLALKMVDMQNILGHTQSENSKLRGHVRALIGGRDSQSTAFRQTAEQLGPGRAQSHQGYKDTKPGQGRDFNQDLRQVTQHHAYNYRAKDLPAMNDYEIQLGSMFQQKFMSSEMMDSTMSGQDQFGNSVIVPLTFGAGADRQRNASEMAGAHAQSKGDTRGGHQEPSKHSAQAPRRSSDAETQSKHSANRGTQASLTASFDARNAPSEKSPGKKSATDGAAPQGELPIDIIVPLPTQPSAGDPLPPTAEKAEAGQQDSSLHTQPTVFVSRRHSQSADEQFVEGINTFDKTAVPRTQEKHRRESQASRYMEEDFNFKGELALNNAFQVTDIIKEELVGANEDMELLRQALLEQNLNNAKLRNENVNLKEKVHQYRKMMSEQKADGDVTQESSVHEQPAAPAVLRGRRKPIRSQSNLSSLSPALQPHGRNLRAALAASQTREDGSDIAVDLDKLEQEDFDLEEDLDEIRELEDLEPVKYDSKRKSGLSVLAGGIRLQKQTSSIMPSKAGPIGNIVQQSMSGEAQDLIAESISVMLEKSHNLRSLFYNLEVALLKILGKHCSAAHFMIVDHDFIKEINQFDRNQSQFKIRKLTVGPDFADLVRLNRPPPHPFKAKQRRMKLTPDEKEQQKEQEEAAFATFVPEFQMLEKVTTNAVVKSNCIVYPVFNFKKGLGQEAKLHNNCKLVIQLDIPRDKIGTGQPQSSGMPGDPKTPQLDEPQSSALRKQQSLTLQRQMTSVLSGSASAAAGTANDNYSRSFDSIKQIRLVVNCFLLALEQQKQERRANYCGQRVQQILETMKIFMKAKRHQDLYADLQTHLPRLFGYEKAGVMFNDHASGFLYSIRCQDYQNTLLKEEHIMRYPPKMGLTGIAMETKKPHSSLEGEDDTKYSFEVDNIHQLLDLVNILIVPLIDAEGRIMGVVQLINKIDSVNGEIPEEDAIEFMQIGPSIAEVLNFCDLAKEVTNVSAGLSLEIEAMNTQVNKDEKTFQRATMPEVVYQLAQIDKAAKDLVETKRQGAFEDGTLLTKIFLEMQKQRDNENKKRRAKLASSISTLTKLNGAKPMTQEEVQYKLDKDAKD